MDEKLRKYQGIFPAFYACYNEDGSVSAARVKRFAEYLLNKGVTGLYVGGSSGECIYPECRRTQDHPSKPSWMQSAASSLSSRTSPVTTPPTAVSWHGTLNASALTQSPPSRRSISICRRMPSRTIERHLCSCAKHGFYHL